jgi:hypothetical protein
LDLHKKPGSREKAFDVSGLENLVLLVSFLKRTKLLFFFNKIKIK